MLLYLLSYVFMYTVILDSQETYSTKIAVEGTILVLFWVDVFMRKYVKTFDKFGKRAEALFFNIRTILILLMTIDLIIFISMPGFDSRPIRPFRILRCCNHQLIQFCHCYSMNLCVVLSFLWPQHTLICLSIWYFSWW